MKITRNFYAFALIGLGILQFLFGDYLAGRAPAWPAWLPGQLLFAYITGALFILTGFMVMADKRPRLVLTLSGLVILGWAGLQNVFTIVLHPEYGALLTNTFKALTLGSGAFIIGYTFPDAHDTRFASQLNQLTNRLATFGRYVIGLFLLASGIQHFLFGEFVQSLVPVWIPGALFWTYFAGVALAAAGLGLITGIKSRWAATLAGWMVFTWVWVLHLPRAIANQNQNEWTAVFEALAVSGILLTLSYILSEKAKKKKKELTPA